MYAIWHGGAVLATPGKGKTQMNKQITEQIFGVPTRIDDSDKVSGLEAAHYRCRQRMIELEQQFEVKASEIRAAFIAEAADIIGEADAQ